MHLKLSYLNPKTKSKSPECVSFPLKNTHVAAWFERWWLQLRISLDLEPETPLLMQSQEADLTSVSALRLHLLLVSSRSETRRATRELCHLVGQTHLQTRA